MKGKKIKRIIKSNQVMLVGIGLSILFWIVGSAIHVFVFPRSNFIRDLFTPEPHEFWMRSLVVFLLLTFSIYIQLIINRRVRLEKELIQYQERLQSLISELSLTEERERHCLAMDLHDSISQALAISKLKVNALQRAASSPDLERGLGQIHGLIEHAIQQTRSLTFELSPPVLHQFGLEAAVESLVERMQETYGIHIDFTDDKQPKPLTDEARVLLFRAVKELLVNVIKHAQVRSAAVSVGREDGYVRIMVVDDGVGFATSNIDVPTERGGTFGLFSIKERLRHLNGYFEIASRPSQGTQVTLLAPLHRDREAAKGKVT